MQFEPHHLSVLLWAAKPSTTGVFRLGISKLGGPDVLGSADADDFSGGYEYQEFQPYVTEINIENSVNLTNVQDAGGELVAQIILHADRDILEDKLLRVGRGVKIGLKDYVHPHTFTPFFYGVLTGIQTIVETDNTFKIVITASDLRESVFNTIVSTYEETYDPIPFAARTNLITQALFRPSFDGEAGLFALFPYSGSDFSTAANYPATSIDDGALGDLIAETVAGEGAWLVSGMYEQMNGPIAAGLSVLSKSYIQDKLNLVSTYPAIVKLADNENDGNVSIVSVNRETDTAQILNNIKASLSSDSTTFIEYKNQDSIDLYGQNSLEVSLNVYDETDLQNYIDYAATATVRPKIKSITCDAIAHKNRKLHDVWQLYPSAVVEVDIEQPNFVINERYLVTRVAHRITVDTWETDLELWRTN
jgi:hypothetical protein